MRALAVLLSILAACSGGDGSDDTSVADDTTGDDGPSGNCSARPADVSGEGTYYAATGAGNCSFPATPNDLMVAAMNHEQYATADLCGACVEVTGPIGTAVVRIVDQCPECQHGDLDLSPQAFDMIAVHSAGRVPITWHPVACPVQGALSYEFKDGSSQYWTAIQVRNHRYAIDKVEIDGTAVDRVDYNYFIDTNGAGAGPYTLRITDVRGQTIEEPNVMLGDNQVRTGTQQFATCAGD